MFLFFIKLPITQPTFEILTTISLFIRMNLSMTTRSPSSYNLGINCFEKKILRQVWMTTSEEE